jgi:hypothetical protein
LRNIGISDDEISERHLHLHGWRHFLNTELLKGGLTIPQTQAVTRHKSDRMTEWYLHFNPEEFAQARKVQDALLDPADKKEKDGEGGKAGTGKKAGRPDLKIVKIPKQKKAQARKGA